MTCFPSRTRVIIIALFLLAGGIAMHAQTTTTTDVPRTISYQGLLSTSDGATFSDGRYQVTVTLYADQQGTRQIWQNTYSTQVNDGVFNLYLGEGKPLPDLSSMNMPLWIGTSVDGAGEMRPLTPLSASPYALNVPAKSITSEKLADGAVTAEKLAVDYISEVQIDGQKISAKGTVLNLVGTPTVPLSYDEETQSVTIGQLPAQTGDKEKGASPLGTTFDFWTLQGDGRMDNGLVVVPAPGDWIGTSAAGAPGIPFDMRANGATTLVLQPSTTPGAFNNIVGGTGNAIGFPSDASVIGGGGGLGALANNIFGTSNKSVISGGETNTIGTAGPPATGVNFAAIGGGQMNTIAGGPHSTISGGIANSITGPMSTIGGGGNNVITAPEGVIAGGHVNRVDMYAGAIVGGHDNWVMMGGDAAFIGGGRMNHVDAMSSAIGGGNNNNINTGAMISFIGGGEGHNINAPEATIGGGHFNTVDAYVGTIAGGHNGTIAIGADAGAIGGGRENTVNGTHATIAGGDRNATDPSYAQTVVGFFNATRGAAVAFRPNAAAIAATDLPLFIVGNGDIPGNVRSNAFEVSYNGHSTVFDQNGQGAANPAHRGARYDDNTMYAWACIDANGGIVDDFGVGSVNHVAGSGVYTVNLSYLDPYTGANTFNGTLCPVATIRDGNCGFISVSCAQNPAGVTSVTVTTMDPTTCAPTDLPFTIHVMGRP